MIEKIISWSIHNRLFAWVGIAVIIGGGIHSICNTPVGVSGHSYSIYKGLFAELGGTVERISKENTEELSV